MQFVESRDICNITCLLFVFCCCCCSVWLSTPHPTHAHASSISSWFPTLTGGGDGTVQWRRVWVWEWWWWRQGKVQSWWLRSIQSTSLCCCHFGLILSVWCNNTSRSPSDCKGTVFKFQCVTVFPWFPLLALFQDCSADGPGQPSMQETPETKNGFKKKEAQDQGSPLCS